MEGAPLQSRAWSDVARGVGALAVQHPGGEWEVVQYLEAVLTGPECYTLRGLLRGQAGAGEAAVGPLPAGAPVVLLDQALVRMEVDEAERGAQLLWRATPYGVGGGGLFETDVAYVWRGLHARPWSPAHLSGRRTPEGGVRLRWIPRSPLNDDWSGEPTSQSEADIYRVQVIAAEALIRSWEVASPEAAYAADAIAADFPLEPPPVLQVEVRQGSPNFGWGVPARRTIRL